MGGGCGRKSPTPTTIFFLFFFFAILSFYSLHFVFFLSSHSVFFFTHPFWVFLLLTFFFSFFTYTNFNKNIMSLPSVSSNRDTIVNLYNFFFFLFSYLSFQSNKGVLYLSIFSPLPKHTKEKLKFLIFPYFSIISLFSITLLFHPN